MPFNIDDVLKYNKRLTATQQKKGAKQLKPSKFRKSANGKKCSTCEYFNLEWCELYNYLVSPNDTCNLYMPTFSYGIKK